MRYASSWAWLLLLPLIVLVFYELFLKERRRSALQFSSTKILAGVATGLRAKLKFLVPVLKALAVGFAIAALARPQESNTKVNRTVEGIDIVLALDVSDSMRIEDMKPENRLVAAKDVMTRFIHRRVSDRIGLVIFAGEAFTACPPTLDYEILTRALSEVVPEQIKQGTAIGVGLATSVARLKDSTARSRVVVLLTDGENNTGTIDPATATEIAKGYGVRVYTIGIGQNGQAQLPIEIVDAFGHKIKRYQPIHSSVNDDLLTQIAESTGGKYYRAVDTDALRGVFGEIDKLEKTKIQTNQFTRYSEFFQQWLKWAVLIYACQLVAGMTVLRRAP